MVASTKRDRHPDTHSVITKPNKNRTCAPRSPERWRGVPVLFLLGFVMTQTPSGRLYQARRYRLRANEKRHIESHYPTQAQNRARMGHPAIVGGLVRAFLTTTSSVPGSA